MPVPGFVSGHNNETDIVPLDEVDPTCLFQRYVGFVEQEWEGYEDSERDGDRIEKPIGLASTVIKFPYATNLEYKYFFVTLLGGKLAGKVTAYLQDQDLDEWAYFNGTMHMPKSGPENREWGEYKNLEILIDDLERIS